MQLKTFEKHLIKTKSLINDALTRFNKLGKNAILFIVDDENRLIGSLTDGDVRRGLLKGYGVDNIVDKFIQANPKYIRKGDFDIKKVIELKRNNFDIIPILDEKDRIVNIINFNELKSYLPIDAIIMAGGRGERLRPLTDKTPKPLLKVGNKPIIEHNVNRLRLFGISNFWISINYLGEQIKKHLGEGEDINIKYINEDKPLGTIGSTSKIKEFEHDYVLVINSDLLTNLNFEHFFLDFIKNGADFSVVTIPYQINIPYAVLEVQNRNITDFKEKPTYTYYSNGGIYLMKKEIIKTIPEDTFYNTTDLMEVLIQNNKKIISYPLQGYWLDIGKHEDFEKANLDIERINFD